LTAAETSNLVVLVACFLKLAASEFGGKDFRETGNAEVEEVMT
jgi:hypothetical protein